MEIQISMYDDSKLRIHAIFPKQIYTRHVNIVDLLTMIFWVVP
jgi:hypothetical protein